MLVEVERAASNKTLPPVAPTSTPFAPLISVPTSRRSPFVVLTLTLPEPDSILPTTASLLALELLPYSASTPPATVLPMMSTLSFWSTPISLPDLFSVFCAAW